MRHVEERLERGSELLRLVCERVEARLAAAGRGGEGQGDRLRRLEEALVRQAAGEYPRSLAATIQLPANAICLTGWPAERRAAVGLGDGTLQLVSYFTGAVLGSVAVSRSGLLSVAARPLPGGR